MSDTATLAPPIRVLIAALGGEGGGVLASWLRAAAIAEGHFVQGTSVPGVAQRTGATTYYMEIIPGGGRRHHTTQAPVLALNATPGEVDLVVASELLEAARAMSAGFVTPDRTCLIASTGRVYTVDEKAAAGDGRLDPARLVDAITTTSRTSAVRDYSKAAREIGCPISPVLLGAIAAAGVLPMTDAAYRTAIETEGKAVARNLRGFDAGFEIARRSEIAASETGQPALERAGESRDEPRLASLPAQARDTVATAMGRLCDYQDRDFAEAYLQTVLRFAQLPQATPVFVEEFARQLALRSSVEDVIRVAQVKLRDARLARVRAEAKADRNDLVDIVEYLKPGREEICGLLPPRLGLWLEHRLSPRHAFAMTIRTTRLSGYLRLKALASLRRWRRGTLRFAREEAWRRDWLALVERAHREDPEIALAIVALAGLVRGYGGTYARGAANYARIVREIVEPMLAGSRPHPLLGDALLQARIAASKDPEGGALEQTLAAIAAAARASPVGTEPGPDRRAEVAPVAAL